MKKVMTIVGTRPELIKLSMVIPALDKHTEHVLVHTGQNYDYELFEIFFSDLDLRKPDRFLGAAQDTTAASIARIIEKADNVLEEVEPDAVLIYGDTNSCLSVIAAKRRRIPVFHMEAGNRCFDLRVPEELNRKLVDHLSDVNLTITEHARRYLIAEGIGPERVMKIGSSMMEILHHHSARIESSSILLKLSLKENEYIVVSAHREENIEDEKKFHEFTTTLNALAEEYGMPVIVSTHPRTRRKIESSSDQQFSPYIQFLKPLGFVDYIALQKASYCVVSDSGTITEEASILGFPAITIREAHERPEGMDEGTLVMTGLKSENVIEGINVVVDQSIRNGFRPVTVQDYAAPNVSFKVVRIILSYIDYINRTVWYEGV